MLLSLFLIIPFKVNALEYVPKNLVQFNEAFNSESFIDSIKEYANVSFTDLSLYENDFYIFTQNNNFWVVVLDSDSVNCLYQNNNTSSCLFDNSYNFSRIQVGYNFNTNNFTGRYNLSTGSINYLGTSNDFKLSFKKNDTLTEYDTKTLFYTSFPITFDYDFVFKNKEYKAGTEFIGYWLPYDYETKVNYFKLFFSSDLSNYSIKVFDENKKEIELKDNVYLLEENKAYTYEVSKSGYKDITGSINLTSDKTIDLVFVPVIDTSDISSIFLSFIDVLENYILIIYSSSLFITFFGVLLVICLIYLIKKMLGGF